MNALRQKMRPKHQLLILKCYPKLPKSSAAAVAAEEVKPNGSELSYLLYYASARRSKLTKVGTFLERKTSSDVYKGRSTTVLVTLQILTAFLASNDISGSKDGFGLLAPFVLRILKEILAQQRGNVEVVEGCLPVWEGVCRHQDHATLAADAGYRSLFTSVVRAWADFARKNGTEGTVAGGSAHLGPSDTIRIRKAGLEAMHAIAGSEALSSEPSRQMETVIGVLLANLYSSTKDFLDIVLEREHELSREKETAAKVRPSMQTVRTSRTNEETDAKAAGKSAAEADKDAEQEVGLLAMRCLRTIYRAENRAQIRAATECLLSWIAEHDQHSTQVEQHNAQDRKSQASDHNTPDSDSWAVALVKMVCLWTPVQDSFVVLFIAAGNLTRSPVVEQELDKQLLLAHIIGKVLGDHKINLGGLSVMDIQHGLVQHVLLILQIGTKSAALDGGPEPTLSHEDVEEYNHQQQNAATETVSTASPIRIELLDQLKTCITNLATHIYYTDQISDMVSAILLRLKPSPMTIQNAALTAAAIEDPASAAADAANKSSLKERPNTDGFFSFGKAREIALDVVKDIIVKATPTNDEKTRVGTATSVIHNPVPVTVWEGTQWLLRDSSDGARSRYIDALCTWLVHETSDIDSRLEDNTTSDKRRKEHTHGDISRRAVSNASARRGSRRGHSTFLKLLQLAVYEEAMARAHASDGDDDFVQLHLLLSTMIEKLGINAVRSSLPMIFRLQEDIQTVQDTTAKIRLGSLVHGYLWALSSYFSMQDSVVNTEIHSEISRRQQHNLWTPGIKVPPHPLGETSGQAAATSPPTLVADISEPLRPFEHRQELVERIVEGYVKSFAAPTTPSSPPASPSRSFSMSALTVISASHLNPSTPKDQKLAPVTEDLNAVWSKEILLAAIAASAPKSISLSGSRTGGVFGTQHDSSASLFKDGHRHLLAAANTFPMTGNNNKSVDVSPTRSGSAGGQGGTMVKRAGTTYSSRTPARLASRSPGGRRFSASTQGGNGTLAAAGKAPSTRTNSVAGGATRIEDLKRALATGSVYNGGFGRMDHDEFDSDEEDSLVDVEGDMEGASSFGADASGEGDGGAERERTGSSVSGAAPAVSAAPPQLETINAGATPLEYGEEGLFASNIAAMDGLNAQGGNMTVMNGSPSSSGNAQNTAGLPETIVTRPSYSAAEPTATLESAAETKKLHSFSPLGVQSSSATAAAAADRPGSRRTAPPSRQSAKTFISGSSIGTGMGGGYGSAVAGGHGLGKKDVKTLLMDIGGEEEEEEDEEKQGEGESKGGLEGARERKVPY